MFMETKVVKIDTPKDANLILGQTHFIKSVEDLYEAIVNSNPNIKFGIGFVEASGDCLIRHTGNDEELEKAAAEQAYKIGAGHTFIIFLRNGYPINVLNAIKMVPEVCRIFTATANPTEVIIAETDQGKGLLGVIDGSKPKGIEDENKIKERKEFLRKIGYKQG
ncbi:MAG: adenosine-specific kinase [Nanoarchaeota archaeon]|nr:adenosine-specific kinase [Nanoarchaeota archaeon]